MKISIENCTQNSSLLQLLKFIRNIMEKPDLVQCSYGTIDWENKIKEDNIRDNSYNGILPWGESILHLCIDNEEENGSFPLKSLLVHIYPKLKNKNVVN